MQKAAINPAATATSAANLNTALLTARIATLTKTISTPAAVPVTVTASTLQLLKQPALAALASKDQALASQVASISAQATAALKDAQTKQKTYQSAITAMLQGATSLLNASP